MSVTVSSQMSTIVQHSAVSKTEGGLWYSEIGGNMLVKRLQPTSESTEIIKAAVSGTC
jgi:hypothetical protein